MNDATSKHLTPRQRLEGLRALVRHKANHGKILTGRVSERKSDFENKLKAEIPKTHAECEARLKDLQAQWTKIEEAKEERGAFKAKQKEAEYQFLFADIVEGDGQLTLAATDPIITRESMTHLKTAITTVQTQEESRGEDDVEIEYPRADVQALENLEEQLDEWLAAAGLDKTELASDAAATHPDDAKPKGKGKGKSRKGGGKNLAPKPADLARAANEARPEPEAEADPEPDDDDEDLAATAQLDTPPSLRAVN